MIAVNRTVTVGKRLEVQWAFDRQLRFPAKIYYDTLSEVDQAKLLAVAHRLAEGFPLNHEKFRYLDGENLYELKAGAHRFLGDYRAKGRFLLARGVRKQGAKLRKAEFTAALRVLLENDRAERDEQGATHAQSH